MRQVHAFLSAVCFGAMFHLAPTSNSAPVIIATVVLGLTGTWLLCCSILENF